MHDLFAGDASFCLVRNGTSWFLFAPQARFFECVIRSTLVPQTLGFDMADAAVAKELPVKTSELLGILGSKLTPEWKVLRNDVTML